MKFSERKTEDIVKDLKIISWDERLCKQKKMIMLMKAA